jgi:choline-glycine betaine transporter
MSAVLTACPCNAFSRCLVGANDATDFLSELRNSISLSYTWLFASTKFIYFAFMVYVAYRYGHIHLAEQKDERPEFSTLTYAIMIFTSGVSNGLLVYSVAEPLSHQKYHFFAQTGYRSQDEIDVFAVNLAVTDWGLAGWAAYSVVAVAMSLAAYRFKLPLILRSCFFPILGHYTWGWMGDLIDSWCVVVTLCGCFTSLGLASLNVASGFQSVGWVGNDATESHEMSIQTPIIWVITILSIASILSGLHGAFKYLCIVAFGLATLLLSLAFFLDDTKYLLNLQVQEVGYYLQHSLFELNLWTDTFGQLREGSGRAIDGKASEQWWMSFWFNFMQSWW